LRRFLEDCEHLFETLDAAFRLLLVLFKSGCKVFAVRRLCHLRQPGENLFLGEVALMEILDWPRRLETNRGQFLFDQKKPD
jgi:hypothetical protein